jgi:protein phosphatase
VQLLVDSGAIRPDQVDAIPQNVIMQALGTQPNVEAVLTGVKLCRDDHLLICSDGLSNKLNADEMLEIVSQEKDLDAVCDQLVSAANERGGEDNITVIVARFEGDTIRPEAECESIEDIRESLATSPLTLPDDLDNGLLEPELSSSGAHDNEAISETPASTGVSLSNEGEAFQFVRGRRKARMSFLPILVTAIISLLMVAAVAYVFSIYLKQSAITPGPVQGTPGK